MALESVEQVLAIPTVSGWAAKFCGMPLPSLIRDLDAMANAQVNAQKAVGHDALFAYVDALYIPEAFGCSINFSSSPASVEPLDLKNEADVEVLHSPDVLKDGRLPLILALVEKLAQSPSRELPVLAMVEGPFTTSARICGTEKMMRAVLKNRALVEKLLDKVEKVVTRFGQAAGQYGADGLFIADPVGSSTMVSPKVYRELVLPTLQRCIAQVRTPVILHVCGNTEPILDMMAETGAKILSLDQCMDLAKARQRLAGRCGLAGNVDPVNVLMRGTVDDVKRETLNCLRSGGKQGYILMAGCAVPPGTPLENLKAMIDTARLSA